MPCLRLTQGFGCCAAYTLGCLSGIAQRSRMLFRAFSAMTLTSVCIYDKEGEGANTDC